MRFRNPHALPSASRAICNKPAQGAWWRVIEIHRWNSAMGTDKHQSVDDKPYGGGQHAALL